jgi:hypothetical protein
MFTITHPKAGDIDFPDGTSDEDIAKAMRQLDAETMPRPQIPAGHGMGDLRMAESKPSAEPLNSIFPSAEAEYNARMTKPSGSAWQSVKDMAAVSKAAFDDASGLAQRGAAAAFTDQTMNTPGAHALKKQTDQAVVNSRAALAAHPELNDYIPPGGAFGMPMMMPTPAMAPALTELGGRLVDDPLSYTPAVGLAKPIAKGVEYGARELAGPVGRGMQKVAVMQAKSAIPINIPFARKGAQSETFLKEGLLSGGKEKAYEKSAALSKQLGNEVVGLIDNAKNEGKTIDGLALIDNLKSKNTSGAIETKEGIRLLEPASKRILDQAEKIIKKMSLDGDGRLNVKQANAVKQWLQKKADYPGQALAQGLTLTAEADAAGLTAADLGHEFRTAIESKVPEVKDLNARLAKVIPAKQAAGWKQAVRDRQELVPLKALVAVTADIAASKGAALGLLAMNTAWKSGRISQTMYNLGSKLIKAGNVAEKTKIETAMEKAVSKGMISNDEIEALKSQLEIGKRPFLPSITEPNELAPRSRSGRPVLGEQPPTYVPRQGSTESPFGKPQPPAPIDPELAGWEALDPRNRQALPEGQGSIEDMAPPEMAQARQKDAQEAIDAYIRQDRPPRPTSPLKPAQQPELRVIERPIKKPPTQSELFGPSDLRYRRQKMYEYLQKTTGKDPFMSEVYGELEKLGKKNVPKAPEKEIIKREFKGRTKPEDHAAMEDLLSNGGHGVETITIKAEDAPKTFTLGGVEFTKGRTLYGKTVFKGIRDRKFMVSSDGLIHMDKPLDEVPF